MEEKEECGDRRRTALCNGWVATPVTAPKQVFAFCTAATSALEPARVCACACWPLEGNYIVQQQKRRTTEEEKRKLQCLPNKISATDSPDFALKWSANCLKSRRFCFQSSRLKIDICLTVQIVPNFSFSSWTVCKCLTGATRATQNTKFHRILTPDSNSPPLRQPRDGAR